MDASLPAAVRARRLVRAMTQEQKLSRLTWGDPPWFAYYGTAGHVSGIPELCVPDLVLSDAGSGVAGLQIATTVFPSGVAQASTWRPGLLRRLGRAIGTEAHAKGINVMLAPGMNVARTPYGGRNFEYFGEDPYLATELTVPLIRGIQDRPVLADAKHFAFNDQETDRDFIDVTVDERTRREIYLPAFEAAVRRADVGSVMCAYNKVDGRHGCENRDLLTGYLRREWGFDGFVVSDWGATHSTAASARAGMDLEMHSAESPVSPPGFPATVRYFGADDLQAAVDDGALSQRRVDAMVRNIVQPMFEHGLFEDPVSPGLPAFLSDVSSEEHQALAREVATDATVLLKNRDDLLPLDDEGGRTIAVIGWAANPVGAANAIAGGGSSHGSGINRVVSPLEGILAAATARGDRVVHVEGSSVLDATLAAQAADVAVVVATDGSTEMTDRPDLGLRPAVCVTVFCQAVPIEQEAMIEAVTAANPSSVVVLDVGGPVRMPWLEDAGAVLVPWYGGIQHGHALADVLYGVSEPGGRLPQTFPVDETTPDFSPRAYPGVDGAQTYEEGLLVGYRWYDATGTEPLFPFGFGLGYTTFDLDRVRVRDRGARTTVSVRVTNTGERRGTAVPQVYVSSPRRTGAPPYQLKGFRAVEVAAGASRRVTIRLDRRAFAHWSTGRDRWVVAAGRHRVSVGPSSRHLVGGRVVRR